MSFPRPACARLAPRMRQLHSGDASLFVNEPDDSPQHLDMRVFPNAKILRTDASLRQNGGCLGQDKPRATYRSDAKMNEMPIVRVSILA